MEPIHKMDNDDIEASVCDSASLYTNGNKSATSQQLDDTSSTSTSMEGHTEENLDDITLSSYDDTTNPKQGDDDSTATLSDSSSSLNVIINQVISMYRRNHQRHPEEEPPTEEVDVAVGAEEPSELDMAGDMAVVDSNEHSEKTVHQVCQEIRMQRLQDETWSEITLRMQYFHKARQLRKLKYQTFSPWGIFGLFLHLSDIRQDMEWAQDASYRASHLLPYLSWADFDYIHQKQARHLSRRNPWFVYLIMIVSTILMVYSFYLGDWKLAPTKINPMVGVSPEVLFEMGALNTQRVVAHNEWYRLFAPMVLHAGIVHYVINMLAMYIIGTAIERIHGTWLIALVFFLSGLGGNMASAVFSPNALVVGASGGLFGLLGICMADCMANWDMLSWSKYNKEFAVPICRVLVWLFVDILLNLGIGLMPFVDNFAHLGGFVYGFCLGMTLSERLSQSGFFGKTARVRRCYTACWRWVSLFVVLFLLGSTFGVLYASDPEHGPANVCPGCKHLSCVPFPFWKENKWWECDDCALASGMVRTSTNGTSSLELQCPFGGAVVDVAVATNDPNQIRSNLADYCRLHCR